MGAGLSPALNRGLCVRMVWVMLHDELVGFGGTLQSGTAEAGGGLSGLDKHVANKQA